MNRRTVRFLEIMVLFVAVPIAYAGGWIRGPKFLALLAGLIYVLLVMTFTKSFPTAALKFQLGTYWKTVALRFIIVAMVLTVYMALFEPDNFLILPRRHPWLWLAIMLFYPLFSALPQEIIYRMYYDFRFRPLFL